VSHRHRPTQLVFNRARNRARARLVTQHQDEYENYLAEELEQAEAEQNRLEEAHRLDGPIKLKGGRRAAGETLEQRVRTDVGSCPRCVQSHDAGHRCPSCGALPGQAPPPRKTPEQRIADLLRIGKSSEWIATNLGEPRRLVDEIDAAMRRHPAGSRR
jgi:hypothetical protein